MEPTPPAPQTHGLVSPLRLHPRGAVGHALQWDAVVPPGPAASRRHQQAKLSPRHVKLQSVNGNSPLPVYATTTLRDQIHGNFRHELFQFHQILQDAVAHCALSGPSQQDALRQKSAAERQLALETQRSGAVLDVLTSDRHAAVMREFFAQWQHASNGSACVHEQELLSQVVDAIFRNLPTVLTENDVRNATSFMRFVDTLKTMRELVLSLLYKTCERHQDSEDDEIDENDVSVSASTKSVSGLFASTSALLAAIGGPKPSLPPTAARHHERSTAAPKRIPLYLYCQQLERELEALKRRLRNARHRSPCGTDDDVGLLNEQTLALLVQFWELPKVERLAFFCQVASQAKQDDCDSVLRVFLDKCDTGNLLSLWDALQLTPQVQHALAVRKHGDDVDAAAREATEALVAAGHDVEERHQRKANDDGTSGDSSDDDERGALEPRGRRGKRFALAGRGGHRPSHQQVDLRGLTEVFEHDEDGIEDDLDGGGGDGWGHGGGKRRRRRLRIRDRGRTPEGHRGGRHDSSRGAKHGDARRAHQKDMGPVRPDSSSRSTSTPPTPKPVLERLHSNLLELLKGDDPELDSGISDAAWKLVEIIDRTRRHDSVAQRGVQRRLTTFQQQPGVAVSSITTTAPLRGLLQSDPLGNNLTPDQQYFVKIDQLQSLLASLGGFSLHTMSTDTISSAFKRVPALSRLFQAFQGKVYASVGLDPAQPMAPPANAPQHPTPPGATSVAEAATAPAWADDQVMNSVEVMLTKLGKMVRSLAPIAEVGSTSTGGGSTTGTTASGEILKLAEAMEEIASSVSHGDPSSSAGPGGGRRHLSLDPARRLAMLNRLKSLAQSNQIESLTGLLTSTSDDIAALRAVSDHQQRQLQAFTGSDFLNDADDEDRGSTAVDENGSGEVSASGNGEVDDVLKLVKKAKIRRASAAKLAAASAISGGAGANGDASNDAEDDDQSLLMNPNTAPRYANRADISLTFKQAASQRGSKLFNAGILLRVVDQMYREHYETMCASLQYGSRRMEFSEFMYDWHIRKYGLKSLAQQHLLKLIQSLRKHERKVFPCQLCLRFLGIVNPLGFHEHKFVLGLLDKWSGGTFAGASRHRVEYVPRQFKVRVSYAIATIQEALSERFGVYFRTMDAVTARIKTHAMRQDEEFIKESDLLTLALDEWQAQRQRIEQILSAVYTAGDLNGDGSLEYDEFNAVMFHLSPSLTDKFVQRVFTAAHDYLKPRRISFERFLDVVLLERVLNTNSTTSKSKLYGGDRANANATTATSASATSATASASASSAAVSSTRVSGEDEEIYQFNLLQETWEHDRETVAQALSAIPHAPTVASLQFRVTFLTQILSKRVDSKTAWMCHRQIMREIRKYQHLNDDQIVAVKSKEETFRKAVLAIRNLQRLSVAFRRPTATVPVSATAEDVGGTELPSQPVVEDDEPPQDLLGDHQQQQQHRPDELQKMTSYVSVVEGALAGADGRSGSSLVDIEALEDQIREKFLERADEGAIDDFKSALQTIRRISVQAFPSDLDLTQLAATREGNQAKRASLSMGGVLEEEEEDEDDDDEEDDDEGEEAEEVEEDA